MNSAEEILAIKGKIASANSILDLKGKIKQTSFSELENIAPQLFEDFQKWKTKADITLLKEVKKIIK